MQAGSSRTRWLSVVLGVATIAFALAVTVLIVTWLVHLITGLQKEVAAALVTGSGTIIVAVVSVLLSRRAERNRDLWLALRDKKVPIYESFAQNMMRLLFTAKDGGMKPEEAQVFFRELTPQLMVWASDEVLVARSHYQRKFRKPAKSGDISAVLQFEDFMLLMRRDLGHKNKGVGRGALLGLFITDLEQYVSIEP